MGRTVTPPSVVLIDCFCSSFGEAEFFSLSMLFHSVNVRTLPLFSITLLLFYDANILDEACNAHEQLP